MKLYSYSKAPSPRRVRIYLAEKGIELDTVEVDLGVREQFSEEYRQVNPRCVVPYLLLDDGSGIGEAATICEYLEELHPTPALYGASAEERARVRMWDRIIEDDGFRAIADALRNSTDAFRDRAVTGAVSYAQIPALAERGLRRTHQFLDDLDARLAQTPYVAGQRFSVADITTLVCIDFARWVKVKPKPDHANLKRWYEEVSSRPSAAA